MSKADWDISGAGGQSVVDETGSMRCQLAGIKLMLWNGRNDLTDSEVVAEIKLGVNTNYRAGLALRSDASAQNGYKLYIYGGSTRIYYFYRFVNGVATLLGTAPSTQPWNVYTKTRFKVDGFQLSVEEYTEGAWHLIMVAEDTEQSLASGYAGLLGLSVSGYPILFDNVEMSEK